MSPGASAGWYPEVVLCADEPRGISGAGTQRTHVRAPRLPRDQHPALREGLQRTLDVHVLCRALLLL